MFYCLILTVVALTILAVMLHNHEAAEDRDSSIRLFFVFELVVSVIGALLVIARFAEQGRLW